MSDVPRLPGPQDEEHPRSQRAERHNRASGRSRGRESPIPTLRQIQGLRAQLARALMVGLISPQVANTIRALLTDLVRDQSQSAGATAAASLDIAQLKALLRSNPLLLQLLEPLTTDEELRELLDDDDSEDVA